MTAALRLRVLPRFPSRITGQDGVKVTRAGHSPDLTVSLDFENLGDIAGIPDPAKNYFAMWDEVTGSYVRILFQSMFDSSGVATGYPTKAAAELSNIPIVVHAIEVYGETEVGDGNGGLYVDVDNGSADTFVSAGGTSRTWYRAADVHTSRVIDQSITEVKLSDGVRDLLNGAVQKYDTQADAEAATIPATVGSVVLEGGTALGDGLGGLYVDVDNGSGDTFTSSGGTARTWYKSALETPVSWSFANTSSGGIRLGRNAGINIPEYSTGNDSKSHIVIGHDAAKTTTRARGCIVVGYDAGSQGQLGFANILIGESAGRNVTSPSSATSEAQGTRNLMIGTLAGYFNTTGNANHFIGRDAGHANTTGNNRLALGYIALGGHNPIGLSGAIESQAPTTASEDVFVGYMAGRYNNGDKSVGVGTLALAYVKDGSRNAALGANALDDLDVDTWFGGNAISRVDIAGTYSQTGTTVTVSATASGAVVGRRASVRFTSGAISSVTTEAQYVTVASKPDANTFTFTSPVSLAASGNCVVDWVETTTSNGSSEYNTGIGFGIGDGLKIGSRNLLLGALAGDVSTFNSGGSSYSNRLAIGTQSSGAPLIAGDFANGYVSINGVNADLLHPFQVRLRSSGAELFRVGSDSAMRLISADATASAGPIFSLDRNSASPAANDIIGSVRYLGRDSGGNETNYADFFGTILDPTNGSEDATLSLRSMVAGSIGVRVVFGGGLYHPLATGGDKGDNTINFGAVYDDNVLLTCYPIEAANTGIIDLAAWDAVAANGQHDAARRFAAERMDMLDVDQFISFWRERGHLPSLPSREEWAEHAKDKLSTGEMIQRLWETVDLLAVHIAQIRKEAA